MWAKTRWFSQFATSAWGLGWQIFPNGPASRIIRSIAEELAVARSVLLKGRFQHLPRLFLLAGRIIHPLVQISLERGGSFPHLCGALAAMFARRGRFFHCFDSTPILFVFPAA